MDRDVIENFKKEFAKIKSKGFIPSNRIHDTGIGKTFEDLMNIAENNIKEADYKGVLELKSKRELSGSMLTLFTKSPTFPKKINTNLREKYGKPHENHPDCKVLHTTVSGAKFNTFIDKYGFKLEVDRQLQRINLNVKELSSGEIIEKDVYYSFDDLTNIINKKCKNIAVIYADSKKENGTEFFSFTKAILMTGLAIDKFLKLIEEGIILYDIRLGVYGTGKNKGKTHDHGSGFRVHKKDLNKVFDIEEI
ncbi:MvaI/BcnI restriction endonuclease family protein [Candidatus Woesearchaeota archaeon]|nr:MvaI/BcnI restriction endonuclease family protein [Candidatus Woesearchaeota archaeon]